MSRVAIKAAFAMALSLALLCGSFAPRAYASYTSYNSSDSATTGVIYQGQSGSGSNDQEPLTIRGILVDLGAGKSELLTAADIVDLMNDDGLVDSDKLWSYVEKLAAAYNTYSTASPRTITNHAGEAKSIISYYGWSLNGDQTFANLSAMLTRVSEESNLHDLLKPKGPGSSAKLADILSVETDPAEAYTVSASWNRSAASHDANDYGGTYVEVDMGVQHVYVFVNNELVIDTPCVTGMMTEKRKTPEGIYSIYNKQRDKVLTGYNPDGSIDYESFVTYWMPFNGGIGLHDASWRSSFGGSIYVNSGSHGCINMPSSAAAQLYSIAYVGMPVICYY